MALPSNDCYNGFHWLVQLGVKTQTKQMNRNTTGVACDIIHCIRWWIININNIATLRTFQLFISGFQTSIVDDIYYLLAEPYARVMQLNWLYFCGTCQLIPLNLWPNTAQLRLQPSINFRDVRPRGLASASRPKNLASASALASWVVASASWVLASASWVLASRPLEAYSWNGTECDWEEINNEFSEVSHDAANLKLVLHLA